MDDEKKYCIMCKHLDFDLGWGGTDVTPGSPASLGCLKGYWDTDDYDATPQLREYFGRAQNCPDFEKVEIDE